MANQKELKDLDDYVLMEIFKYCKGDSLSLTCKRFYNLICKSKRYRAIIGSKNYYDKEFYGSLVNSHKVFDELAIYSSKSNFYSTDFNAKIKAVSKLRGADIKELQLVNWSIDAEYFFDIMNYFPNIQQLRMDNVFVQNFYMSTGTLNTLLLKDLTIDQCNDVAAIFLARHVPHNVLTSLSVDRNIPDLLINQQSIKKLRLFSTKFPFEWSPSSLTHYELHLNTSLENDRNLCSILQQQPNLEELHITACYKAINGNMETFETLCNLKKLKVLVMECNDLLHVAVDTNFQKLKTLEELEFVDSSTCGTLHARSISDIMMEISYIRFENLRTLTINIQGIEITVDQIRRMGENYHRLKYLNLTSMLPLPLDVFLDSFQSLNTLIVEYLPDQKYSIICSNLNDKIYPNLQTLELYGLEHDCSSYQQNIENLKKSLPNLKERLVLRIEDL